MPSEQTIEAIKTALQNEEKAENLYRSTAEKANNETAKKVLFFLAEWELSHIERLKQLHAHLLGEMQIESIKTLCIEDPNCNVKDFFASNIEDYKNKLDKDNEDLEIFNIAIQKEKEAESFYNNAAQETNDEEAKQVFSSMAKEEKVHQKFLENQQQFFEDPNNWHMDDRDWFPIQ